MIVVSHYYDITFTCLHFILLETLDYSKIKNHTNDLSINRYLKVPSLDFASIGWNDPPLTANLVHLEFAGFQSSRGSIKRA